MVYVRYVASDMAGNLSHFRIVTSVDRCCVCTMGGVAQKGNHRREHDCCVRYVTSVLRVKYFRLRIAESVGRVLAGTTGGVVRHPARNRYERETSAGAKEECYKRHVLICDAPEAVLMLRFFRRAVILCLIDCVDGRGLFPRTCYWSIDYVSWCKVYAKQDSNQRKERNLGTGSSKQSCQSCKGSMDFTGRFKVSYIITVPGFEERYAKTTTRSMSNMCVACIAQMIYRVWRHRGISWRGPGRVPARAVMAFRSETATYRCGLCKIEEKFFKLYCSERPKHLRVDEEGNTHKLRICKQCEQKEREDEWAEWSDEKREENPKYTAMDVINKAHKRQCKGERWYQAGLAMKGARDEINEEIRKDKIELNKMQVDESVSSDQWEMVSMSSLATSSRKEKKTAIMMKSKSLAFALIDQLMKCDMLMNGFANAGKRMKDTADAMEVVIEREVAWERSELEIAKESVADMWEEAAGRVADHTTYQTASEHGENQSTFLKALDFADEVGPDIRIYNVCTQD